MDFEEYHEARDKFLSEYERSELAKYGLDHILDKLLYEQSELKKKNEILEKKLDDIYFDLSNATIAQINLLPKKLNIAREISIRARFIPSRYVSGDTYNIFRLDEDHLGLYQIDISGHGVSAALFSVSLTQMLNAYSFNNLLKTQVSNPPYYEINSPTKVVSLLNNEHFVERYDIYFTMIYMIINIHTGEFSYARAGHNPPVILRGDHTLEHSDEGGLPIGWDFDRKDPLVKGKLLHGDKMFIFSDGIIESRNKAGETYGEERLWEMFRRNAANDLDVTLNTTISDLSGFTKTLKFDDDISIIALKYLGKEKT
jgi:sigma-B regulation protein RsbU (phosphoserine phosphatase)